MIEPSLALQGAILTAVKGQTDAGDNVFDRIEPLVFPRVQIGGGQTILNEPDCIEAGAEIYFQIDVFSKAAGYPEVKTIAWQIRYQVHKKALPLDGWSLIDLQLNDAVYSREADGEISRARMTLRGYVEAP
ncbi:DUF3168 domain-containing protein [Rhizobium sp. Rhizsp82]|uniref:DUF3168 domain-containing protein n=1 Tax=Rhizobium sp. Rhizsp82 TaxID=3243057 RepID=UPI0039B67DA4